ncbi:hypothetical protein INT45_003352 [Circinella minor]|uniref:Wax synthase domain-containing protein n=1 Tax=Circinella minor TaxID=1195481 RepID=A0A8H7VP71_9FUNG|nr:hypothetical protein INT45_003352 [Circinella minor]
MHLAFITFILDRLGLYGGCAIPSILFYLLTRNDTTVGLKRRQYNNDLILWSVIGLELALPILYDGKGGDQIDFAVNATLANFLSFGMAHFIRDRNTAPAGTIIEPFYNVLSRWNKRTTNSNNEQKMESKNDVTKQQQQEKEYDIATMRKNSFQWLLQGCFQVLLTVPFMSVYDGFLRVCQDPLHEPYMQTFFNGGPQNIPLKMLWYYANTGIALLGHVVVFPTFVFLWYGVELTFRAILFPSSLQSRHRAAYDFVQRDPLFDRPWLSTSLHDLWSRRWHQIFRWAFQGLVYDPIRAMFPKKKQLGRALGTLGVFLISGLMHDYILAAMFGYSEFLSRPGIAWFQTVFFLLQGLATIVSSQNIFRIHPVLGGILTWIFILYTCPLFIEPYLRIGLHHDATIPGYPQFMDPYLVPLCPYGPKMGI